MRLQRWERMNPSQWIQWIKFVKRYIAINKQFPELIELILIRNHLHEQYYTISMDINQVFLDKYQTFLGSNQNTVVHCIVI